MVYLIHALLRDNQMTKRRIVLAHTSRLLQEMLRRVFNKADGLLVVQEQIGLTDIDNILRRTHPDWLITSTEQPSGVIKNLVVKNPDVRVLTVSLEGFPIQIWYPNGEEKDLVGLSLGDLLTILKDEKEVVLR